MTSSPANPQSTTRRVALIGKIDDSASEVSAFLEQLELEPVVIGSATSALAAIERVEELRGVDFAVMLPARDDEAPQGMLAIGFLLATLGRSKICFLSKDTPWQGALQVALDESGLWKLLLAREMKRTGLEIDLNRAI
jgi:hypothetical protein